MPPPPPAQLLPRYFCRWKFLVERKGVLLDQGWSGPGWKEDL
ncbi:hypothetical protein ACFQ61_10435 [Streptomyces sp. NPDC056500]